jgi:hypothetical protein
VHAKSKYQSYLLRLWLVEENGNRVWRASLEVTQSGEKHGFATLESMFVFLKEQTRGSETGAVEPQRSFNG